MFKFFFTAFVFLSVAHILNLNAQNIGLSPYSKTALGDISNETGNRDSDMGYSGTASYSPNALSLSNPAYLHNQVFPLLPTKFTFFDFSLSSKLTKFNSKNGNDASFGANLNRMALMIPMNKNRNTIHRWGSVIAAKPYSSMNYDIIGTNPVENETSLKYNYSYNGKGGLSEVLWGNGVKVNKNLMVGLNTSYLFGTYITNSTTQLETSSKVYAFSNENRQTYLLLKPGVAYVKNIMHYDTVKIVKRIPDSLTGKVRVDTSYEYKKVPTHYFINFGSTYEHGYALSNSSHISKKVYDANLTEYVFDTISNQNLNKNNLPGNVKVGLSLVKLDEYMILPDISVNLDMGYRQWKLYDATLNYRNTFSAGFGIEKLLLFGANKSQKISYIRAGAYYNQLPYSFNQQHIDEMGITFGGTIKLPGIKGLNDVMLANASFALGKRGTTDNNLIAEKFIKFTLGFTFLEDRWFRKYRLD